MVVDSEQVTVTVGSTNISIGTLSFESQVCEGSNISIDVPLSNNGDCDANIRLVSTNESTQQSTVVTEKTISGNSDTSVEYTDTIPLDSNDSITYTFSLQSSSGDNFITQDTTQASITVNEPALSIDMVSTPSSACIGDTITGAGRVNNNSSCSSEFRLKLTNELTGNTKIVGSTNIGPNTSSSVTFEETISVSQGQEGVAEYSAAFEESVPSGWTDIGTKGISITVNRATLSITDIESASSLCVGASLTPSVSISNQSNCDTQYRAILTTPDGSSEQVASGSINGNSDTTINFSTTVSQSVINQDTASYVLSIERRETSDIEWSSTSEQTININVLTSDISISNIDVPNSECIGQEFNGSIGIANNGECSAQFKIIDELENEVASGNIDSNSTRDISFTSIVPTSAASNNSVSGELTVQKKETDSMGFATIDSQIYNIDILKPKIGIASVQAPQQACVGKQFSVKVVVSNTSTCSSEYRLSITNVASNTEVFSTTSGINAESTRPNTTELQISSNLVDGSPILYQISVERRYNSNSPWQLVAESEFDVDILTSNLEVVSEEYPNIDKPGQKSVELSIQNSSKCSTDLTVNINGSDVLSTSISGNSTVELNDEFKLLDEPIERVITISDDILNETVDELSATVNPHRFISVDQSAGEIEMIGGFNQDVGYNGSIVATGVQGGDNLEQVDSILGELGVNNIVGTLTTDSSDKDTILFSSLKSLNMQFSKSLVIILDSEIQGSGRTFTHNTVGASIANIGKSKGEINTISGPLNMAGSIRRRLGVDPKIVSKPLLTISND